ncbi:hypothetical protein PMIN04_001570 [Paraphaeosphaeria minitans]
MPPIGRCPHSRGATQRPSACGWHESAVFVALLLLAPPCCLQPSPLQSLTFASRLRLPPSPSTFALVFAFAFDLASPPARPPPHCSRGPTVASRTHAVALGAHPSLTTVGGLSALPSSS